MEILKKAAIAVSQELSSKEEATKLAGTLLKDTGSIQEEYIDSMLYKLENEAFATYIGNGVAIPHGMEEGKKYINETAISIIQSHTGVDWNGETAHIIVGIAAKDDEHIDVLSKLAELIEDPEDAKKRDLTTGDRARLYSARGEVNLVVEVTNNVKKGIVFTTFHFPEHMVNMVTGHEKDEETMCAEYKVSAVQIQKTSNIFDKKTKQTIDVRKRITL